MHDVHLEEAKNFSIAMLESIYKGESLYQLMEAHPECEKLLKSLASQAEPAFYPLLIAFNEADEVIIKAISSTLEIEEFLIDCLTVLSVMDVSHAVVVIDTLIQIGESEYDGDDLSLEQRHALGANNVYSSLSMIKFSSNDHASGGHIPYETHPNLEVLHDKIVEVSSIPMLDESLEIARAGVSRILNSPCEERINDFWVEFISNEDASELFFNSVDITHEEALEAWKEVQGEEIGCRYGQRIVEDAIISSSHFTPLELHASIKEIDSAIEELDKESGIGHLLWKARLMH